ncbi:GNAT family N-acetyltransferase [soil metagenome]
MNIILETPRLILRQFNESDVSLLQELNSDPEVIKYLHDPVLYTEEKAKDVLKTVILPQYKNSMGRWAIHTRTDNEFIGWCGLNQLTEPSEIDLGYRLIKTAWGKGYATEAAKHTLSYGFNKLKLAAIIARAHFENLASICILQKIGMQFIRDEMDGVTPVKTFIAINNQAS